MNMISLDCIQGKKIDQVTGPREYEKDGFPLEDIAQSLYVTEMTGFIRSGYKSFLPVTLLAEVIVLLNGMDKCKMIPGFDEKVKRDRKKLSNIIKSRNLDRHNPQKNLEVYEQTYAIHNEYNTAAYVNQVTPIEFTGDKDQPDYKLGTS